MTIYKIRHKPTGLYFTPSRGSGNLSFKGKIYASKPNLEWTTLIRIKIYSNKNNPSKRNHMIISFFKLDWNSGNIDKYVKTNKEDWEIIEICS